MIYVRGDCSDYDTWAYLPGVGENLQDHLLASVIYEARQPLAAPNHQMLESQLFWKSDPRMLVPDLQPLFMHLPYYAPGFEGPTNAYTLCAGIIRPASRGSTKLTPTTSPLRGTSTPTTWPKKPIRSR